MKVSIEEISNTARRINLVIPAEKIKESLNMKCKHLSKTMNLDGFRKGHVPIKLIQEKYGYSIYQEVIGDIIDNNLNKTLANYGIEPIGEIMLDSLDTASKDAAGPVNFNQVVDVNCTFSLQVYPEVKFNDFSSLSIKVPEVVITPNDVEAELLKLRKKYGPKVAVERAAINGDIVTVDFAATIDNQEFSGGKEENVKIELGKGSFIDEIESGLIGTKAGDEITLNLTLPKEYVDKSVAGKLAVFNFKVKQVEEQQLADINADLAKELNIDIADNTANNDTYLQKIYEKVTEHLNAQVKKLIIDLEQERAVAALIDSYPIELPVSLLEQELKRLKQSRVNNSEEHGKVISELSDQVLEELKIQANKNVHQFILLRSIIKQNELKVDSNLINAELNKFNSYFNYFKNNKMKMKFKNYIVNSKYINIAIDFLAAKVNKVLEPMTVNELIELSTN